MPGFHINPAVNTNILSDDSEYLRNEDGSIASSEPQQTPSFETINFEDLGKKDASKSPTKGTDLSTIKFEDLGKSNIEDINFEDLGKDPSLVEDLKKNLNVVAASAKNKGDSLLDRFSSAQTAAGGAVMGIGKGIVQMPVWGTALVNAWAKKLAAGGGGPGIFTRAETDVNRVMELLNQYQESLGPGFGPNTPEGKAGEELLALPFTHFFKWVEDKYGKETSAFTAAILNVLPVLKGVKHTLSNVPGEVPLQSRSETFKARESYNNPLTGEPEPIPATATPEAAPSAPLGPFERAIEKANKKQKRTLDMETAIDVQNKIMDDQVKEGPQATVGRDPILPFDENAIDSQTPISKYGPLDDLTVDNNGQLVNRRKTTDVAMEEGGLGQGSLFEDQVNRPLVPDELGSMRMADAVGGGIPEGMAAWGERVYLEDYPKLEVYRRRNNPLFDRAITWEGDIPAVVRTREKGVPESVSWLDENNSLHIKSPENIAEAPVPPKAQGAPYLGSGPWQQIIHTFWHSTKGGKAPFWNFDFGKFLSGEGGMWFGPGSYVSEGLGPQIGDKTLKVGGKGYIKQLTQIVTEDTTYLKRSQLFGAVMNALGIVKRGEHMDVRHKVMNSINNTVEEILAGRERGESFTLPELTKTISDTIKPFFDDPRQLQKVHPRIQELAKSLFDWKKEEVKPMLGKGRFIAKPSEIIDLDKPLYKQPEQAHRLASAFISFAIRKKDALDTPEGRSLVGMAQNFLKSSGKSALEKTEVRPETFIDAFHDVFGATHTETLKALTEAGLKGSMFYDHVSRHLGDADLKRGSRNYVIFDPKDAIIEKWYDTATGKVIAENPALKKGGSGRSTLGAGFDPTRLFATGRARRVSYENDRLAKALLSSDDRSATQFMIDVPMPVKDMPVQLGLSSASFRTTNVLLSRTTEAAAHVYNYVNNKILSVYSLEHKNNLETLHVYNDMYKHYKRAVISRWPGSNAFDWSRFKKDLGIILEAEGGMFRGTKWFDGQNYTPTISQFVDMGLSPESAQVWRNVGLANEKLWFRLVEVSNTFGRPIDPSERVPMWMPHVWKGPYKVTVTQNGGHVAQFDYTTRREQQIAYKTIQDYAIANGKNWDITSVEPSAVSHVAGMLEDLWKVRDKVGQNKGLDALIKLIEENSMQGIITHALERKGGKKMGHLLERAAKPGGHMTTLPGKMDLFSGTPGDIFGLTERQMYDAIQAPQRAAEAINAWHARGKLMGETIFPLLQYGYLELPHLRKAVTDIVNSYINVTDSQFRIVEEFVKSRGIQMGLPPNYASWMVKATHGTLARMFLVGHLAYYAINTVQWTVTPFYLMSAATKMKNLGMDPPSVIKAVLESVSNVGESVLLKPDHPAYKYAKEHGYIDPVFVEHLDPVRTARDFVAEGIDRRTRYIAFMMSYNFFKNIPGWTEKEVLDAAGKAANAVNVPYSPQFGMPTLMRKVSGKLFKPVALFSTFPIHMMGLVNHLRLNMDKSAPKATYDAIKLIGAFSAFQMFMFGINGMPLVANYNDIIYFINKVFNENFPTTKEWVRHLDDAYNKFGMKEIAEFGILSALTRYDISNSAQGPGFFLPGQVAGDMIRLLVSAAVIGGKWAMNEPATKEELWKFSKQLPPPMLRSLSEYLLKEGGIDVLRDAFDFTKDQTLKDYIPDRNIADRGNYIRNRVDTILYALFGIRSVEENKERTSQLIDTRQEAARQKRINYLVQTLKESIDTMSEPQKQKILSELASEQDPDQVLRAIVEHKMTRLLTDEQKRQLGINDVQSAKKYERYQEIQRNEPKSIYNTR